MILWIQLPLNNTYNTFTEIQLPLDNVYFQSTHNTSATAITFADAITTQHSPAAAPGKLTKVITNIVSPSNWETVLYRTMSSD